MAPLRVLIVATTPRALANDRALLAADPEVVLVTDADDAEVTLLDLTEAVANELPAGAGDLGRTLLLLADAGQDRLMNAARARGASVVTDDVSRTQLLLALRTVASGLRVQMARPVPRGSESRSRSGAAVPTDDLTPREREILRLLAEGLANREIAALLGLSDHTVKFHLRAVFTKLGAHSRTEAVSMAVRRGLLML
ncbi:MAG: response regulator transcription factor [Gemmatimonadota bacterium]|nr:response regulator transcription factor [Gemmatimonadota bacterium]